MRDFSEALTELRRRHGEAQQYLRVDELRRRRPQLEVELSRPDLWDDQAAAGRFLIFRSVSSISFGTAGGLILSVLVSTI